VSRFAGIYFSVMRTGVPNALPMFRSDMQLRLLALLLLQAERVWTLTELRKAVDAPASSVHRELNRIEGAGLLDRDASSKPHRFGAASESPLFEPLRELLLRTVGVENDLRDALDIPGVVAAAIHGSWAAGTRRPGSDIDVVVIGEADLRGLRRRTRAAGERAGRRIDLTLFGQDEFRALASEGRGFARHLADEPIISLVGNIRELAKA
jgi:predicted nucleotidyltransferase